MMTRFPFNHFMLWCRGWYTWPEVDQNNIFANAQKAFELDGYIEDNNAYLLAVAAFEKICDYLNIKREVFGLFSSIESDMKLLNIDFKDAAILAIRNWLRYVDLKNHKLVIANEGPKGLTWTQDKEKVDKVFGNDKIDVKLY